ncbi:MAG TPA: DUF2252 domain-containing protein [Planctomycetota bacterium]|nr:DUF2252 domain-containing protein [Planctomycetota bacterium]
MANLTLRFSNWTITPDARLVHGKEHRRKVGRAEHAVWAPAPERADPVALLREEDQGRVPELLAIKYQRMTADAFSFFRGSAALMAADLAAARDTGLRVQLCGDAHVKNLGAYASDEGRLVFDLNDFDETIPGPFEWDIKRMATSMLLGGALARSSAAECRAAVLAFMRAYRESMRRYSLMGVLELRRFEVVRGDEKGAIANILKKAERRTPEANLRELTVPATHGLRRFHHRPPMRAVSAKTARAVLMSLELYRDTLGAGRRLTLDGYRPHDVAFKVVGTGSIGTLDYVILLYGNGPGDPLFLQVKQALPSCYAKFIKDAPQYSHQGKRIADGQYCMQTMTDPFVGWTSIDGKEFVVRQLADHKASINPLDLNGRALAEYGMVCGAILAKAHARTGDAAAIAGYCGNSDKFDKAIAKFAAAYAEQTERDWKAFKRRKSRVLSPES